MSDLELWRHRDVTARTGLSRSTILRMERAGRFPRRRKIGRQSVAWLASEVTKWMDELPEAGAKSELDG